MIVGVPYEELLAACTPYDNEELVNASTRYRFQYSTLLGQFQHLSGLIWICNWLQNNWRSVKIPLVRCILKDSYKLLNITENVPISLKHLDTNWQILMLTLRWVLSLV